ncbi:hypothetical protein BDZ94DRAFT_1347748 [Collybia nuda]|uniref:Uncharacterized protein n=1 Tax=Collybia nuda TaxID=64659 RepID=A0A9P5XVE5_9AGAR|nr:hypothetical protein BDZ94DRAFT_1347748 [Collybia nuda]
MQTGQTPSYNRIDGSTSRTVFGPLTSSDSYPTNYAPPIIHHLSLIPQDRSIASHIQAVLKLSRSISCPTSQTFEYCRPFIPKALHNLKIYENPPNYRLDIAYGIRAFDSTHSEHVLFTPICCLFFPNPISHNSVAWIQPQGVTIQANVFAFRIDIAYGIRAFDSTLNTSQSFPLSGTWLSNSAPSQAHYTSYISQDHLPTPTQLFHQEHPLIVIAGWFLPTKPISHKQSFVYSPPTMHPSMFLTGALGGIVSGSFREPFSGRAKDQ